MPQNDTASDGAARLSLGRVAIIVDRIRRTPGLEADAEALARHLAAVENDETWAGYVERMVAAMGTAAREQAEARTALSEVRQAVADSAQTLASAITRLDALQVELKAHRDAREHAASLAADVDKVRVTSFYDKVGGPLVTAFATLVSLLLAHWFGVPMAASPQPASTISAPSTTP